VLIDDNGSGILTDFGLSKVIEELSNPTGNTTVLMGTVRWQAPELLFDAPSEEDEDSAPIIYPIPSKASDVYSFASTIYEVSKTGHASQLGKKLPLDSPQPPVVNHG